ncbi:MAG TPA: hypothetical protein VGN12_18675 [Pirellulales bacterium]|jgi:hypothetical protein
MLAPSRPSHDHNAPTLYRKSAAQRFRTVGPVASYRTKDDCEPVGALPRWTSWAMFAWLAGTVAAYSLILARWWE